ncbi:unnamed protein product [Cylindrotheca closterium]|uniref:Uncharacterized protein n=1 Tax=Cylindrotheca closterium TaxID=2856 RepID=A0AAD2FKG3_9STRA|nr:unnamed protein product [Cylindrotheca closterium]
MVEASFANQASNLSALGAAMGSFHRALEVKQPCTSFEGSHEEESSNFLNAQLNRLASIEDDLMIATGCILPKSTSSSTIIELAEMCRMVQEENRKKIGFLHQRLISMGATSLKSNEVFSPVMSPPTTNVFCFLGGPLQMVEEGDVETEGATTPGSMINPSPFASNSKPSISPAARTIDQMPLSSADSDRSTSPTPRRSSRSSGSFRRMNFEGFQDEDDMITLDTHRSGKSPTANRSKSYGSSFARDSKGHHQFINEMESMLDKVEESILEGRPSDEVTLQVNRRATNELQDSSSSEGDVSASDDSTDVIATQVASTTRRRQADAHQLNGAPKVAPQRPTQILFDNDAPSPAHTNLTLDATMMNDTMVSTVLFQDDDNTSVMTPILDRYRLDADDNSVGVKVVPNKRGTSSRLRKPLEDVAEEQTPMASNHTNTFIKEGDFMSPKGLPGTISARKKKQYRKTPLPKRTLHNDDTMDTTMDENDDPNLPIIHSSPSVVNASPRASSSTLGSFTLPPLRQSSLDMRRNEILPSSSSSSTVLKVFNEIKGNPKSTYSGRSRADTSVSRDIVDNHQVSSTSESRPRQSERFEHESVQMTKWMEHITMAEYDVAPRIVQVQVRRDEANKAIDLLEDFFTTHLQGNPTSALEFGEQQGYGILGNSFNTAHKCKSILMSLCHFRRLLMHRDEEMHFTINQFSA